MWNIIQIYNYKYLLEFLFGSSYQIIRFENSKVSSINNFAKHHVDQLVETMMPKSSNDIQLSLVTQLARKIKENGTQQEGN